MNIDGNTNIPLSSDNILLDLFKCYVESFGGDIPITEQINPFDVSDGFKFDLYTETKKYLGEDIYTTSITENSLSETSFTKELTTGSNIFNPFNFRTSNLSLQIPLKDTNLITNGSTAGDTLENSDVIWMFADGVVEGAWLKGSSFEFTENTACIKLERGDNEFRFPYPNRGLSGEGLEWTGKGINNCNISPYINQEERNLSKLLEDVYWLDKTEKISASSIALNQTNLVYNGATASKYIEQSDTMVIKPVRDSLISEFAWLYDFNRTEIPIVCGSNNIYFPIGKSNDGESFNFNIDPNFVEDIELTELDLNSMVGSVAGLNPNTADQILKQSSECDSEPNEGAWLSGSNIDIFADDVDASFTCKDLTNNLTDPNTNFNFRLFNEELLSGGCVEVGWGGGRLDDTINIDYNGKRYAVNSLGFIPYGTSPDPFSPNMPATSFREVTTGLQGLNINGDVLVVRDDQKEFLEPYITNAVGNAGDSGGDPSNITFTPTDCSNISQSSGVDLYLQSIYLSAGDDIIHTELVSNLEFLSNVSNVEIEVGDCQLLLSYEQDIEITNYNQPVSSINIVDTGRIEQIWDISTDGSNTMTLVNENHSPIIINLKPHKPSFVKKVKTISGRARQMGLCMVAKPNEYSHFFWEFPDMDLTEAINGYDHDSYCNYNNIKDYTSIVNPKINDPRNQWEQCNCKAVYHSPIGNNLNFDNYKGFSDCVYIDSGVDPFSYSTWTDENGNNYKESDQFAVYKYKGIEPDTGYGIGIWETLKGEPMILQKGKNYIYKRADFGGCSTDTAPPLVVKNNVCYDSCGGNVSFPIWAKMVRNGTGEWVSTGEKTDMELNSGQYYQYIKRGKIEYKWVKNNLCYDRITETPDFSLNIPLEKSTPYWAKSVNQQGYNVGVYPKINNDYLITTQPEPSNIILDDDVYIKYNRVSCDAIEWRETLDFVENLNTEPKWKKIKFTTETPNLLRKIVGCGACELIFSDSPNSCYIKDNRCDSSFTSIKSTNEDSDMILRTSVNCGETTEIYYQAHKPLTWDQQFNVTSLLNINNTTSTVYTQATKPWLNILNGITPTVRVHERNETLVTKEQIGIFKPENLGITQLECFGLQLE